MAGGRRWGGSASADPRCSGARRSSRSLVSSTRSRARPLPASRSASAPSSGTTCWTSSTARGPGSERPEANEPPMTLPLSLPCLKSEAMPENGNDLFNSLAEALEPRYRLERELGRGKTGVVFLAHEVALDLPVALKVLSPSLCTPGTPGAPHRTERFLREARTAARLSHPHIVPIFAVERTGPFVYFTMAYIAGHSL